MTYFFTVLFFAIQNLGIYTPVQAFQIKQETPQILLATSNPVVEVEIKNKIPDVPFYSQFTDIESDKWKKVGCGIASLAMIIDYYKPNTVSINTLLKQGIKAGAYLQNAGWTHVGLISLGNKYGIEGNSYDLANKNEKEAFAKFQKSLAEGPVIASIHYKFDPENVIPHLVVINGIKDDIVYYNDPAANMGGKTISVDNFLKAWKKRYIVLRA